MKDKKALFILIPFLLFVLIVGALAIVGDRILDNPPETVGNTAGNLNNSGYFCEYDGTVYFANAYDSNTLYSMDPSKQNIKKLGNASVKNILAGENIFTTTRPELPGMPVSVPCAPFVPLTAVN